MTAEILTSNKITNPANKTLLSTAALTAGIAYLIMATAPFAEFFVYQKLVIPGKAAETVQNIIANKTLFLAGIFGYLMTFICDGLIAWALYILLKPVNENLSLLSAWSRLIYTMISIVALLNLVTVLRLLNTPDYLAIFKPNELHAQVLLSLGAFRDGWAIGFIFFDIHLVLLGYLIFKSNYIPRIIGLLLIH